MYADWLSIVGGWSTPVLVTVLLFECSRRLMARPVRRGVAAALAAGWLLGAAFGGMAFWMYQAVSTTANYNPTRVELPDDWGNNLSTAQRESGSRSYAQGVFLETGAIRMYFAASGQRVAYQPTADDLKKRESWVETTALGRHVAKENLQIALLWVAILIFAPALGVMVGFFDKQANNTLHPAASDQGTASHGSPARASGERER